MDQSETFLSSSTKPTCSNHLLLILSCFSILPLRNVGVGWAGRGFSYRGSCLQIVAIFMCLPELKPTLGILQSGVRA